jgi:5'-nucleotidase
MNRAGIALISSLLLIVMACVARGQDEPWPRSVLITNDDGIEAEGLLALVRTFAPEVKVYVAAPLGNRSGSTNYVSAIAQRGLEMERRDMGEGVTAYAIDGYPADAVVWALKGLLVDDPPDLVISGVNTGPNLTGDWNLSGTVGAAQIAAFFGVPAIAVSGWTPDHAETLEATARWMLEFARGNLVRDLEPGQYLTVSVPRVAAADIQGAVIARRSSSNWDIEMAPAEAQASSGRERWSLRFTDLGMTAEEGTDLYYYQQNYLAIVPMRVDEHDWELLENLGKSPPALPSWQPEDGR